MATNKAKLELVFSIVFMLAALIFTFYVIPQQIPVTGDFPDQRTFPLSSSIILCFLSFIWVFNTAKKARECDDILILKGIGVGAILLLTVFLYELVGYFIAGVITSAAVAFMIARRKLVSIGLFSVCLTILYYLFFSKLLNVVFPSGIIF